MLINGLHIGYIYRIYNIYSNKSYIGQTSKTTPHYRFYDHISKAYKPNALQYNAKLQKSIREEGKENFNYELIEMISAYSENELIEKLNNKEQYYIDKYNCLNDGFNISIGGLGKSFRTKELINSILDLYNNGNTMKDIAFQLNICIDIVQDILKDNNIDTKINKMNIYKNNIIEIRDNIKTIYNNCTNMDVAKIIKEKYNLTATLHTIESAIGRSINYNHKAYGSNFYIQD